MALIISDYTVGDNEPLNHARILWDFKAGTASGDGTGAALAANDYTAQRWDSEGAGSWVFEFDENQDVDTFVIAAHNLSGTLVSIETSSATDELLTTEAGENLQTEAEEDIMTESLESPFSALTSFTPADNSPIFVMANTTGGAAFDVRRYEVSVDGEAQIGIIRAGKALQMQRSIYSGHNVSLWNRVTEGQQAFSETGQWLGRTQKRLAYANSYEWEHITAPWYRDNFEPFAQTLPLKPFAIAGNPEAMPQDVAWGWAQGDVQPQNMGVRNFVTMGIQVTGFAG